MVFDTVGLSGHRQERGPGPWGKLGVFLRQGWLVGPRLPSGLRALFRAALRAPFHSSAVETTALNGLQPPPNLSTHPRPRREILRQRVCEVGRRAYPQINPGPRRELWRNLPTQREGAPAPPLPSSHPRYPGKMQQNETLGLTLNSS